ncbi:MAG TPA: cyanoexosortase B system-associated protein [Trichocoleus sp.]
MTQGLSTDKTFHRWIKVLLVVGLAAIATLTAIPNWMGGQWPWMRPPQVAQMQELRTLRKEGLTLPGWTTLYHTPVPINDHDWTLCEYQVQAFSGPTPAPDHVMVLFRPQPDHSDQPALEWMDLAGAQSWKTDSRRSLPFSIKANQDTVSVKAQFLRSWSEQQTFAVLQWYAWPGGGSASPSHWFWADQGTQWRTHRRLPWVAVSLLVPIEPLGEVSPYEPFAIAVGQQIQAQLLQGPLAANS